MGKDYIGFTVDLQAMASVLAQDPQCREELIAGINAADAKMTTSLGAANTGTKDAPQWYTLFASSVEGKQPGEQGLFYRNSSQGGKGDRIQMRLKKQTQQYSNQRPAQQQYQVGIPAAVGVPTQGETAAAVTQLQNENPELFAQLLAKVNAEQGAGQQTTAAEYVSEAPAIPSDIQVLLDNAG